MYTPPSQLDSKVNDKIFTWCKINFKSLSFFLSSVFLNISKMLYMRNHRIFSGLTVTIWSYLLPLYCRELSEEYLQQLGRHNYVTPTSYLELISSFKTMLARKRGEVFKLKKRYEVGLEKLQFAASQVSAVNMGAQWCNFTYLRSCEISSHTMLKKN